MGDHRLAVDISLVGQDGKTRKVSQRINWIDKAPEQLFRATVKLAEDSGLPVYDSLEDDFIWNTTDVVGRLTKSQAMALIKIMAAAHDVTSADVDLDSKNKDYVREYKVNNYLERESTDPTLPAPTPPAPTCFMPTHYTTTGGGQWLEWHIAWGGATTAQLNDNLEYAQSFDFAIAAIVTLTTNDYSISLHALRYPCLDPDLNNGWNRWDCINGWSKYDD